MTANCAVCVPRLYESIIEEVIAGVREHFLDDGIDEQVLAELKQMWEQKLKETKAADHEGQTHHPQQQTSQPATTQLHNQQQNNSTSVQNSHHSHVVLPSVNLVPVQITVPAQQAGGVPKTITIHVPSTALANGVAGTQLQTILSSPAAAHTFALDASQAADIIQRQLNTALQQHGISLPPQLLQLNHASSTTQVDGAADLPIVSDGSCRPKQFNNSKCEAKSSYVDLPKKDEAGPSTAKAAILPLDDIVIEVDTSTMDEILLQRLKETQVDGLYGTGDSSDEISDDDDDDDDDDNDDIDKKEEELDENEEEADGVQEPALNSDDDVSDDESGDIFETENVVVCQYDKITRVRNKWKFHLKDGIMNLKGKDYLFQKATGEGEW